MNSAKSGQVERVHTGDGESKPGEVGGELASLSNIAGARETIDPIQSVLGVGDLLGEFDVDQVGGRAGINNKKRGLTAVDDGGHDELMTTPIDASPVLHGWRFETVEAAEIICWIAA